MSRFALFFVLPFSIACANVAAEPIGIPACDDFLTKYEVCLSDKVPAAQQSVFKTQIEQLRARLAPARAESTNQADFGDGVQDV